MVPAVSRFLAASSTTVLLATATGCAGLAFTPSIESMGEYKNTSALTRKAADVSKADSEKVKVMVGQLPEGMTVAEGTLHYDAERYELLGKVAAQPKNPSLVN